jgi:glycosyltransferase involved in cell wall biosynthesis
MNLLGKARSLWRLLTPMPLRRLAQPALGVALRCYVRAAARVRHQADHFDGPIRIVGFFGNSHGIAASAKLAIRGFEALGVPIQAIDVSGSRLDWTGQAAQDLAPGPWIFHLNAPELLAAMAYLGPRRVLGPRYGYWAWELPKAPKEWLQSAFLMDEIWAPSTYTAKALEGGGAPTRVVPHPLFIEDYRDITPMPREVGFLAVTLFDFNSSAARKNPEGTIEAFARAFGGDPDARLVIKTQNGDLAPQLLAGLRAKAPANVEIVDEVWPYARVKSLIATADVLISLHRAEGFGLTVAEAMAIGTPVIATGWSGNLDFMDEACALVVPSSLVPVDDPQGIYRDQVWAEPDVEAAARALRRLRDEPGLARQLSEAGRRRVAERLSPQAWFATLPDGVRRAAMAAASASRKAQAKQ